jgi:hemerythrin-like domain-containing protein
MEFFDALRAEHRRIESVLGALRIWAGRLVQRSATLTDRDAFVHFFRTYAGAFHHEREEDVLLPALTGEALLPAGGPIEVILSDHRRMGELLSLLAVSAEPERIAAIAKEYSHALWLHIDVEDSVFFPESERQLRRNGVTQLTTRPMSATEATAAAIGDALIARYPPQEPDVIRGEGCVMCHAYGDTCRGLEREWWNDWEWEEMSEHVAAS